MLSFAAPAYIFLQNRDDKYYWIQTLLETFSCHIFGLLKNDNIYEECLELERDVLN